MPAFAMEMVCCSMASWMATWSFTSILSNSSMQQMPLSASIRAPPLISRWQCISRFPSWAGMRATSRAPNARW